MRLLHTSDWHLGRQFHGASLLQEQAAATHVLCWHVHEASFIEVSDTFIADAVRLLVLTLRLGSHFDVEAGSTTVGDADAEAGGVESLYHWTLPAQTSNAQLRRLLASLPPDDPRVRATGTVTLLGDAPRQHPPDTGGFWSRYNCAIL